MYSAHPVQEKLNEAIMMLNKNLNEINIHNMDVELVAQMFKNYQSNVLFHLEGKTLGLPSDDVNLTSTSYKWSQRPLVRSRISTLWSCQGSALKQTLGNGRTLRSSTTYEIRNIPILELENKGLKDPYLHTQRCSYSMLPAAIEYA
jgi:DASH complex subunit DAD4